MKQRSYLVLAMTMLILTLGSCTGNKKQDAPQQQEREHVEGEAVENPVVGQLDEMTNETITATLLEQEEDTLVLRSNDTGLQLVLGYREALSNGMMKGSLVTGHDYSITADLQKKTIGKAINLNEMTGQWFYDMQQHRGLKFDKRGAISSINTEDISFRQWKIVNGTFYIYYLTLEMIAPDRSEYLVEPAEIETLSADNMRFIFLGKTYDCQRQRKALKLGEKPTSVKSGTSNK